MPRSQISCPNCKQPIVAEVNQLFDVSQNPSSKQEFLSGLFNIIQCPHCGYEGRLATPLVYHDPEKELLLTFFPAELSLPVNEQQRIIGPLINKIVNNLPQEKRKAYLLQPQTALTLQSMVERILEADGITKEMIQAQQQKLSLLQRLVDAPDDVLEEITRQEDKTFDADFFTLLNRLTEASLASGDRESARRLNDLQKKLLEMTSFGRELQKQSQEVEAAVQSLQKLGKEATREQLLDLLTQAPNETRLRVLVSLARPGIDYAFFQLLSDRIERTDGQERARLTELRAELLELTHEVDQQMEARVAQANQLLETILKSKDITQATIQNLQSIDNFFIQALQAAIEGARKKGDLEKTSQLQKIYEVLEQASQPPKEMVLIEELLDAPDDLELNRLLQSNRQEITPEFLDTLTSLLVQVENNQERELVDRLQVIYRNALRISMELNLER